MDCLKELFFLGVGRQNDSARRARGQASKLIELAVEYPAVVDDSISDPCGVGAMPTERIHRDATVFGCLVFRESAFWKINRKMLGRRRALFSG